MELTPQMTQIVLESLKVYGDMIQQFIGILAESLNAATLPSKPSANPVPSKIPRRKKIGRPLKSEILTDENQDFGRCSIEAITHILRLADGNELSAADIMSELKRRWGIEAKYKTVSIVLGTGRNQGRFEEVGENWRLAKS